MNPPLDCSQVSCLAGPRMSLARSAGLAALLLGVLLLSACGKSVEERRAEVVKCSGYIQSYQLAALGGGPAMQFLSSLTPLSVGRPSYDTSKLNAVAGLGDQIAPSLDPVRVRALAMDGAKQWATHYGARDAQGVLGFLDACIGNYDDLLKATR